MKIDIITRHAPANYGSILQCYAMEKVLKDLNFDVEFINYVRLDEKGKNIAKTMLNRSKFWNRNLLTRKIYLALKTEEYNQSYKKFEEFRKEMITQTEEYNSMHSLIENTPQADIYCTGSDQVWGKVGNVEYDEAYFLTFLKEGQKKISYASSFGKDKISDNLKRNLKRFLDSYEEILVREKSGVEILNEAGVKSTQTLDPTLLLSFDEWDKITKENIKDEEYILVYQLHNNKKFEKYCKNFALNTGLPIKRISVFNSYRFRTGKLILLPTPNEFLGYIKNAKYVLTDSFHGTVFSIIYNKKFMDILPNETSTRITNLLELLKIQNRILKDYKDFETIKENINYNEVVQILKKEVDKSKNILVGALENKTELLTRGD